MRAVLAFGETHSASEKIVQIRTTKEAPETLVDECGHPRHASLHLVVTPISGCEGFEAGENDVSEGMRG